MKTATKVTLVMILVAVTWTGVVMLLGYSLGYTHGCCSPVVPQEQPRTSEERVTWL